MSHTIPSQNFNQFLASLPAQDREYLTAGMRVERPARGELISSRGKPLANIWFPHTGVVALTTSDADGRGVQTAMVGPEGCVGVETLLEQTPPLADATVQIEGDISIISAQKFRAAVQGRASVRNAVLRYLYVQSAQLLQAVACDRLHSLECRCCRFLLLMQDRTGLDELPLTQDSFATLVGGGRPRINKVLGTLERKGLLERKRGRIKLLKRSGLETRACECYRVLRKVFDTMGLPPRQPITVA